MKKIFAIIIVLIVVLISCREEKNNTINIYIKKELRNSLQGFIKKYGKKNKIRIVIKDFYIESADQSSKVFNEFDLVISDDLTISLKNYKQEFFLKDDIVIIGYKKLNNLNELEDFLITIPKYESSLGKKVIDKLSKFKFFERISKNIEYKEDIVATLQAIDLYESNFAFINKLAISMVKNAEICYLFSEINNEKTEYKIYINKKSEKKVKKLVKYLQKPETIRKIRKSIDL